MGLITMYYVIAVVFLIIAYYEFKNIKNKGYKKGSKDYQMALVGPVISIILAIVMVGMGANNNNSNSSNNSAKTTQVSENKNTTKGLKNYLDNHLATLKVKKVYKVDGVLVIKTKGVQFDKKNLGGMDAVHIAKLLVAVKGSKLASKGVVVTQVDSYDSVGKLTSYAIHYDHSALNKVSKDFPDTVEDNADELIDNATGYSLNNAMRRSADKWMFNNTTARTQEDTVLGKVVTDNMD